MIMNIYHNVNNVVLRFICSYALLCRLLFCNLIQYLIRNPGHVFKHKLIRYIVSVDCMFRMHKACMVHLFSCFHFV